MATLDPLDLFRQSIRLSLPPLLLTTSSDPAPTLPLSTYISFPQPDNAAAISILKSTPTRYTSKPASDGVASDEFYTLGQIWLAWTERESGVREYLMKGQTGGMGFVTMTDRRGVIEYLQGENEGGGRVVPVGGEIGELEAAVCGVCYDMSGREQRL
jgi:parafibromin